MRRGSSPPKHRWIFVVLLCLAGYFLWGGLFGASPGDQDAQDAFEETSASTINRLDAKALEDKALAEIELVRKMKKQGVVIETDAEAQRKVSKIQEMLREVLRNKYGSRRHFTVQMIVEFPAGMTDMLNEARAKWDGDQRQTADAEFAGTREETLYVRLAPVDDVPYSVYFFLEHVVKNFRLGAFHRNAGHVLQANVDTGKPIEMFAWQEYSSSFPHRQYTLGYAGRPSGSHDFYISTIDNTENHGPASQGSESEADAIIGKLWRQRSIAIAELMAKQPGAEKGSAGFISDKKKHIRILAMELDEDKS